MIKLPFGIEINNLIDDLRSFSWEAADILLYYANIIKKLEQNYAVRDKQDVLAMCALQYAAKLEQNNNNINSSKDQNDEKVSELINIIDVHLNAY